MGTDRRTGLVEPHVVDLAAQHRSSRWMLCAWAWLRLALPNQALALLYGVDGAMVAAQSRTPCTRRERSVQGEHVLLVLGP